MFVVSDGLVRRYFSSFLLVAFTDRQVFLFLDDQAVDVGLALFGNFLSGAIPKKRSECFRNVVGQASHLEVSDRLCFVNHMDSLFDCSCNRGLLEALR